MNEEIWKIIPGLFIEASNEGRIRFDKKIIHQSIHSNKKGRQYRRVLLFRTSFMVHRLVATAFHGNPPTEKHETLHLNGIPYDNSASNLRWGTHAENMAMDRGNNHSFKGMDNKNRKLSLEDILFIRKNYKERCKTNGAKALSIKFGVNRNQITRIALKKPGGWNHV